MPEPRPRTTAAFVALFGLVASLLLALAVGGDADPLGGLAWVLSSAVFAGVPAAVYLAAALGYGRLLGRLLLAPVEPAAPRRAVEAAMGFAALITLSHALGVLGVLHAPVALAVAAIGVASLVFALVRRAAPTDAARSVGLLHRTPAAAALPAVGVLLVAASVAPGWLWNSEYSGYDALSYHLALVQEWIALGRIEPLAHNVYSYLPSSMESAFFHLAMMTDPPQPAGGESWGLIAGAGWRTLAPQWLHAGVTIGAAWILGCLTTALAARAGIDPHRRSLAGVIAAAIVLATPWVIVVGSLAYNEMAVVALGAGALAASTLDAVRPVIRGSIVGALVGAACGAKPTAIFMLAPAAGVIMLGLAPRRDWASLCLGGAIAGAAMLAPWMIRNALHGGNPVFPYATELFGTAHWAEEQVRRFAAGHHFDGSLADRLRLALWTNPASPPSARTVERFRGLTNPQWAILFPAGFAFLVWLLTRRPGRRVATLLAVGLATQLLAWLLLTHIQSRFLLPCVATLAPACGLACAAAARPRVAIVVGAVAAAIQTGFTLSIWSVQSHHNPTARMIDGASIAKGEPFADPFYRHMPVALTNHEADGQAVYLLGGATPLYFTPPVLYHTTWDESPLGSLMREHPDAPETWTRALQRRGVRFILADFGELDRLARSGWYDPLVTPPAVMAWLDQAAEPVAGWPELGQMLYRLRDPEAAP